MTTTNVTGDVYIKSGVKVAGKTITVANNFKDSDGLGAVSYVWTDDTGNVLSTSASYKLTKTDVNDNKEINVTASYVDKAGNFETKTLSNVLETQNDINGSLNQEHTGGITIKGATTVGSTLSVASTLKDKDGLGVLSYEWFRGDDLTNAVSTSDKYLLSDDDNGYKISVKVSYTDGKGFSEGDSMVDKSGPAITALSKQVAYSTVKSALDDHITATTPTKSLAGGLGADTFIFNIANTKFKISDFNVSQGDKIDLSAIDAIVSNGTEDKFAWLSTKPTTANAVAVSATSTPEVLGAKGALWFDSSTKTLYGSIDNDIDAEFSVVLTGVTTLTANDIVL